MQTERVEGTPRRSVQEGNKREQHRTERSQRLTIDNDLDCSDLPEPSREGSPCTWSDDATALMEHRLPACVPFAPLSGAPRKQ
jgi:hypothetical protein